MTNDERHPSPPGVAVAATLAAMSDVLANENELYLAPGKSVSELIERIGIHRKKADRSIPQRIVGLVLVCWLPMCLFAIFEGRAIGPTPRDSFLLDFANYARFFVGLPILVAAEAVVGSRLRLAGLHFVREGFIRHADLPAFERAVTRLARRRDSVIAMLGIAALAAVGAWKLTVEATTGVGASGWRDIMMPGGGQHILQYSLTALWNNLVAVPIVLFLMYRWLWRILIWTVFLAQVARLDLQLVATHADRAGGLGFLPVAHLSFALLGFGVSSVISAQSAFRIIYEGASISSIQAPFVIVVVGTLILFLGPLLVFCPALARSRRAAIVSYGALVDTYNRGFHEKWAAGAAAAGDEPLLGSSDIQSMADMGNTYRFVDEMAVAPFRRRTIIQFAIVAALPWIPLLFLVVPPRELVRVLTKVVF
jgi:hypothetical protein